MNFALLGDDPAVLPLVRAIARHPDHRIDCAALAGALERELSRIAPGLQILPGWDRILTAGEVESVIICGTDTSILEGAKQIAAAGKPLVIYPQGTQGSTWIYELGLIRDEGRTSIVPVFADRLRPSFRLLREAIDSELLGRLLYLQIDREIVPAQTADGPALLTRGEVEDALLRDVDLLRSLGGDYGRVSAVNSGVVGDRVAAAAATLMGEGRPEATWTVHGSSEGPSWKLVVAGEKGEISLTAEEKAPDWSLRTERISLPDRSDATAFDEGERVLQSLTKGPREVSYAANWNDLVRGFEIVDASRASVRRRRAIDLHLETTSERNIFKSHMTAVGCLLLTFTLVGVVFLLLVMPLFDARSRPQLEAQRANAIIRVTDFAPATATLNVKGTVHVRQIAARMEEGRFPVLIAEIRGADGRRLSERRRDVVIAQLKKEGVKDATERTQVGPIVGEWYPQVLQFVRVLAFLPLGLFLILQAFVLLTRPATK
jgi:hypothetical protein